MSVISDIFAGGIQGVLSSVNSVIEEFHLKPEDQALFKQKMAEIQADAMAKAEDSAARALESVNATMRAEAGSTSWLQQDWRPIVGLTFAAMVINNYILLPYLGHYMAIPIVSIPDSLLYAMLSILGVTTTVTGVEKVFKTLQGK
jgi:Holin of 3TMs, for gene-transfer release